MFSDLIHLERIRTSLWGHGESGRASVMVGAGLSLNADIVSPSAPRFPTWHELSLRMIEKLYPAPSTDRADVLAQARSTSGALRLAQEYQAAFGRDSLDAMLLDTIPDNDFRPSYLHKLLLRLPWADVLTTNYDTLLERASIDVTDRRYSVVRTTADIPIAARPRIVKLHGSFPSTRPYIITEEDFRSYPRQFAPFVNLSQQIAMEGVLCLIGFSGDDPNFLYWTGWVRDHLGPSAPQVYLCGLLNLNTPKRNLLHDRNVVPIDLSSMFPVSDWPDRSIRHRAALEWFILNLHRGRPPLRLQWPSVKELQSPQPVTPIPALIEHPHQLTLKEPPYIDPNRKRPFRESIDEIIPIWKHNRLMYPGWLIAPAASRDAIWSHTSEWLVYISKSDFALLEPLTRLTFLFELNWRLECCLVPLSNEMASAIENVLLEYCPFDSIPDVPANTSLRTCDEFVRVAWSSLAMARLRLAREDQQHEPFSKWLLRAKAIGSYPLNDINSRLYYEEALLELGRGNSKAAHDILSKWTAPDDDPYATIRQAGLYAEIGELHIALELATRGLRRIESSTRTGSTDVYMLSREGWALKLLRALQYARDWQLFHGREPDDFESRWDQLSRLKCDPNPEWDIVEARLAAAVPKMTPKRREHVDFTGSVRHTYHFGSAYALELIHGYQAVRLIEDAGLPPSCNNVNISSSLLKRACEWLAVPSPDAAAANVLRLRNGKALNEFFSIRRVALLSEQSAKEYLVIAVQAVAHGTSNAARQAGQNAPAYLASLGEAVSGLELATKMLYRATDGVLQQELDRVLSMYRLITINSYPEFLDAFNKYVSTICDLISPPLLVARLVDLIELPIPGVDGFSAPEHFWKEPFLHINKDLPKCREPDSRRWIQAIERLISAAHSVTPAIRQSAIVRLAKIHYNSLLLEKEREEFSRALWSQVDSESGLPTNSGLFDFGLLELPEPTKGRAKRQFKRRYLSASVEPIVIKTKMPDGKIQASVTLGTSKGLLFDQLTHATRNRDRTDRRPSLWIDWTASDAAKCFRKVSKWWQEEGRSLSEDKSLSERVFAGDPLLQRLHSALNMLMVVVLPRIGGNHRLAMELKVFISEVQQRGLNVLALLPAFLSIAPELATSLTWEIESGLVSRDRSRASSAVAAVVNWMIRHSEGHVPVPPPRRIVSEVANIIATRHKPTVLYAVHQTLRAIEKIPDALDSDFRSTITVGLKYLLDETAYDYQHPLDDEGSEEQTALRHSAAELAMCLLGGVKDDCPVLKAWEAAIARDPLLTVRRIKSDLERSDRPGGLASTGAA